MDLRLFWPFLLGTLVVFQPALNRRILESRGLGFAAFFNSAVLFILAGLLLLALRIAGSRAPAFLVPRFEGALPWWYVLPGVFGFALVTCVPLAMRAVGALSTVALMLAGQLTMAMVWDAWSASERPTPLRVTGAALALSGALLTLKR